MCMPLMQVQIQPQQLTLYSVEMCEHLAVFSLAIHEQVTNDD